MRIDNKLGLTSSAEQAMHKYLFEDIYDFWGYRYAKETYGVFWGRPTQMHEPHR